MIMKEKKFNSFFVIMIFISILMVNIVPCIAGAKEAAEYLLKNEEDFHETISTVSTIKTKFPARFDLRDRGVVTPVKSQDPWGTCWGFSAISSAETSILSKMGKTYEETKLDLSEHHLAYFLNTYINDGSSQDGEGIHLLYEDDPEDKFNTGAFAFTATSIFSSGIGPYPESLIPYRGKNSLTESKNGVNLNYSEEDDWSIPDEYKFGQAYEMEESNILSGPAVYDTDMSNIDETSERNKHYLGYSQDATDEVKKQLMSGKAVSVGICADNSYPGRFENIKGVYINTETWCHYSYDSAEANHEVCIVGWDDNIKRTDFLDHSAERNGDGTPHYPEGDGAWIIKNSWGSELEDFPNYGEWGLKDENGKQTGYFYLSYYDRSIDGLETFDFNVGAQNNYVVDQYDLMPSNHTSGWVSLKKMNMANVFTAEYDQQLRAVSIRTDVKNADVTFDIYLLKDNYKNPTDGELLTSESEHYDYKGYHKYTLKDKHDMKIGQNYSIVVTVTTNYNGKTYYAISSNTGESEEWVKKINKKIYDLYKPGDLENAIFRKYYCKGIINKNESFIYNDEFGGWIDFSDVVKEFKNVDEDAIYTAYDNIPIKGYSDLVNAADLAKMDTESIKLNFAPPATSINYGWYIKNGLLALAFIIIFIILAVIVIMIRKKISTLKNEVHILKKKLKKAKKKK